MGRSPGSAELELLGCECQSPGLRALLEEVDSEEAGEPPHPQAAVGTLKAWGGGQEKVKKGNPRRGACQKQGRKILVIINSPQRLVRV